MLKEKLSPIKGWNSWDCYGAAVTEDEVKKNAAYLANNLLQHGYEYLVVDIQWYEPTADSSRYHDFFPLCIDEYSRLQPAENRFPSAKNGSGFLELASYVHNLGLKFGIHIMRGIPREAVHKNLPIAGGYTAREAALNNICPWNSDMYGVNMDSPAGQAYYDSLFKMYAEWGVDFVKVDDIAYSVIYDSAHHKEIKGIRQAIDNCGRSIVLSLSPGPARLTDGTFLQQNANMWRLTDDFWDNWTQLLPMFEKCEQWASFVEPGSWPDCDMLPLGHIGIRSVDGGGTDRNCRFTFAEQKTMLTLWSLFQSPLILGCELTDLDDITLSLLTNKCVNDMYASVKRRRQIYRDEKWIIWQGWSDEATYYAIFNVDNQTNEIPANLLANLGIDEVNYELWHDQSINLVKYPIEAHSCILFK